jgi:DNA-binding HxlR family transcriptional regulator
MKTHHGCPVQATINVISGKWKVVIIWHLGFKSRRFAELRRLLLGVSEKVLASQLRELETDGIVDRHVKAAIPPQVTYSLTDAGQELIEPMSAFCAWGSGHLGVPSNLARYPKRK